jgi:hypothetical protein
MLWPPPEVGCKWREVCEKETLRMKNEETCFLHSTNFKLLLQIEANSIKYCDFSKFIIPVQTIVFISRPGCPKA